MKRLLSIGEREFPPNANTKTQTPTHTVLCYPRGTAPILPKLLSCALYFYTCCRSTSLLSTPQRYISHQQHLQCYTQRYGDLFNGFCQGDWEKCDWKGLQWHWETSGWHEQREFNCTHIPHCTRANLNLLNLVAGTDDKDRIPYNICRNLEWQVCAATGSLPGQEVPNIKFSVAPKDMDINGVVHSLGTCAGWRPGEPPKTEGGIFGFTNDDIYFMEVCLFNQLCANNEEMFKVEAGELFVCDFSPARFAELEAIIRTPAEPEPAGKLQCTMGGTKMLHELDPIGLNVSLPDTISCNDCEELHATTPGDCSDMRDCDACTFCKTRR